VKTKKSVQHIGEEVDEGEASAGLVEVTAGPEHRTEPLALVADHENTAAMDVKVVAIKGKKKARTRFQGRAPKRIS
jgi:hypothetical protein